MKPIHIKLLKACIVVGLSVVFGYNLREHWRSHDRFEISLLSSSIRGIVVETEVRANEHNLRIIRVMTKVGVSEQILPFDDVAFYNSISPGDSVRKDSGSAELCIRRQGPWHCIQLLP